MLIKKTPLESATQRKIIVRLEKAGWIVNKIISCSNPGWVDLEAFKKKKAVFIETKRLGKEAEELQKYRHKQLRDEGFEVFVADKLQDILHLC